MSTLNDIAWEKLFKDRQSLSKISDQGFVFITADMMKLYREPRLMAKIDTSDLLPQVFKNNHLSILPVKNGEYIIFQDPKLQSFFNFPIAMQRTKTIYHSPAEPINNFDSFQNLNNLNEAQALDTALIASIIKDFTNEEELWLTIRGRQFTQEFDVFIPNLNKNIAVSKVQIEIDAGYESENAIYIFEAKIGKRENFNIRQLLYPYLEWKNRTSKQIIPIFFYFTNGLYFLFEFNLGNSLDATKIIRNACYSLYEIKKFDLKLLISRAQAERNTDMSIPFPQADDLDKVIDAVSLVNQGYTTKFDLSEIFEFDERQGDYYGNAARFIGFLEKENNNFMTTDLGKQLLTLKSPSKRAELIVEQLANKPVFHEVFQRLLKSGLSENGLSKIDIDQIICNFTQLSEVTSLRRASTVRQWVSWILKYAK